MMFNSRIEITPKLHRYHFSHIITESIYTFLKPIQSNIFELLPSIRHSFVLPKMVMHFCIFTLKTYRQFWKILNTIRAYPIVELYGFIPIIAIGLRSTCPITCPFSRKLVIFAINTFRQFKILIGVVIKIIVYSISYRNIIIFSKTSYSLRFSNTLITACHVIRHYIHNHFQSALVRTCNKGFPLLQTLCGIVSKVWVYSVIILYGIRRARTSFYYRRKVITDTISCIISSECVM